jgi:ribonuclease VapC
MIAVDSSALVAILEAEPGAAVYAKAIQDAEELFVSAVTVLETGMVIRARRGEAGLARMWRFLLEDNDFQIVSFGEEHAREALAAFARFGKGMQSQARLNLCDCAAYALAQSMKVPLLFKGTDFSQTDVRAAV